MSTTNIPLGPSTTSPDNVKHRWQRISSFPPDLSPTVQEIYAFKPVVVSRYTSWLTGPIGPAIAAVIAVISAILFGVQGNGLGLLLSIFFVVPFVALCLFNTMVPDNCDA